MAVVREDDARVIRSQLDVLRQAPHSVPVKRQFRLDSIPSHVFDFLVKLLECLQDCQTVVESFERFAWAPQLLHDIATTGLLIGFDGVRLATACCAIEYAKANRAVSKFPKESAKARSWAYKCLVQLDCVHLVNRPFSADWSQFILQNTHLFQSESLKNELVRQATTQVTRLRKRWHSSPATLEEAHGMHQMLLLFVPLLSHPPSSEIVEQMVMLCLGWDVQEEITGEHQPSIPFWFVHQLLDNTETGCWSKWNPLTQSRLLELFPEMVMTKVVDSCRRHLDLCFENPINQKEMSSLICSEPWATAVLHSLLVKNRQFTTQIDIMIWHALLSKLCRMVWQNLVVGIAREFNPILLQWIYVFFACVDKSLQHAWFPRALRELSRALDGCVRCAQEHMSLAQTASFLENVIFQITLLDMRALDPTWTLVLSFREVVVHCITLFYANKKEQTPSKDIVERFLWLLVDCHQPFSSNVFQQWAETPPVLDQHQADPMHDLVWTMLQSFQGHGENLERLVVHLRESPRRATIIDALTSVLTNTQLTVDGGHAARLCLESLKKIEL